MGNGAQILSYLKSKEVITPLLMSSPQAVTRVQKYLFANITPITITKKSVIQVVLLFKWFVSTSQGTHSSDDS